MNPSSSSPHLRTCSPSRCPCHARPTRKHWEAPGRTDRLPCSLAVSLLYFSLSATQRDSFFPLLLLLLFFFSPSHPPTSYFYFFVVSPSLVATGTATRGVRSVGITGWWWWRVGVVGSVRVRGAVDELGVARFVHG